MRALFLATMVGAWCVSPFATAANVQQTFEYNSSISHDRNGPLDLIAELNYDDSRTDAPIAVVMHGYSGASGHFNSVRGNAQRLRDEGFFVVSVAMRGREGSDGVRDSGGVEIYDIYDAVESVKSTYADHVDASNVHITGYSGGGGNTMSALTKFPDYFRAGSAYFGMSDYGYNTNSGWYFDGASGGHRNQMVTDIGNPTLGDPDVEDRYHARASNLASRNNPYSEIHLFVNQQETTCPPINSTSFRDNAIAAASVAGEFDNITVHLGSTQQATYVDFNENGVNDAGELQSWPHGFPTANQQDAAEQWYRDRVLNGTIPQPQLNPSDELFVAGFVKTRQFEFWLGDGQNAAGLLDYELTEAHKRFTLNVESNNKSIDSKLTVDMGEFEGESVDLVLNSQFVETFTGESTFESLDLADGDTLLLRLTIAGDYDRNGAVDMDDFVAWKQAFGSTENLLADGNGDQIVDAADYTLWRNNLGAGSLPADLQLPVTVPEPPASIVALLCVALGGVLMRVAPHRRRT